MVDDQKIKEKKLVCDLMEGDCEAFDQLFRNYNKRIYYFSKSIIKSHEEAKDIVQDVFLKIWKNRASIDARFSFKSYLFTISYNIIVDTMRKRVTEQKFRDELIINALNEESVINEELEFKELNESYHKAVSELPPKRQQIYKLQRFESLSYQEIADKLDISVNTVRNHMTQAIRFLREKLGENTVLSLLFIVLFV